LVKGIFSTILDGKLIYRNKVITHNGDGEWSMFDIILANNNSFSIIVSKNGTIAAKKYFNEQIVSTILFTYDLEESENLIWTIPMIERNFVKKERFKYFYPEQKNDKFIFKLSFNNFYDLIELTRDGILEDNELKLTFKDIMKLLYIEGTNKLNEKNSPIEKYIQIYERDYKV